MRHISFGTLFIYGVIINILTLLRKTVLIKQSQINLLANREKITKNIKFSYV